MKAAVDAVEKEKAADSSSDESSDAEHAIFRSASDEHSEEKDEKDDADHDDESAESEESSVDAIVEALRPAVEEAEDLGAEGSKLLSVAVDMNVDRVIDELKQSPVISKAIKLRTLKIVGGTYGLKSGEVNWA